MTWWQRLYSGSTRGRIVTLLRRRRRTVDELASELRLTDNAVRAHLDALRAEGVVVPAEVRREGTVGKPATAYDIAPEAGAMFSGAYAPALAALLAELGDRLSARELQAVLTAVGRRMADSLPAPRGDLARRARIAADFLEGLGGVVDVEREDGRYLLRGAACPLAEAVSTCPELCGSVESALAAASGATISERCDRSAGARCRFEVSAGD